MTALFSLIVRICLFQRGPEHLPGSNAVLGLLLVTNTLLSIPLYIWLNQTAFLTAATVVVASLAATAGLILLILNLMNHAARYHQTLSAIVGVDILLTLLTALVAFFTMNAEGMLSNAGTLLITVLMLWNLFVYAAIFHKALEVHIAIGLAFALFIVIFSVAIGQVAASPQ
ncbi:MAG: hypothetical protein AAF541_00630 [Pseudomonadota bacterium]